MENELNKNEILSLTINNNTDKYLLINKKHLQVASILNILDLKGMNNPDNFPMLSLPFLDWILYDRLSVVDTLLPTTPNDKSDVDKTSFEKST